MLEHQQIYVLQKLPLRSLHTKQKVAVLKKDNLKQCVLVLPTWVIVGVRHHKNLQGFIVPLSGLIRDVKALLPHASIHIIKAQQGVHIQHLWIYRHTNTSRHINKALPFKSAQYSKVSQYLALLERL